MKPVADTTGYICVDMHASIQRLEEEKKHTVDAHLRYLLYADVASLTRLVPWHIDHEACDPHPGRFSDDWYPLSEVRTERNLLSDTAHLLEKDWFAHTDWSAFFYGVLNANGGANRMTNADDARVVTMPANVRVLQFGRRQP